MEGKKIKVLIVDDNRNYREAFKRMLLMRDYEVSEAEDADEALAVLRQDAPDVIVTDLWMRTKDEGLELIRQVKNIDPACPIVMISAVGTFEEGAKASRLGAFYVISKSRIEQELDSFFSVIEQAQKAYAVTREQLAVIKRAREGNLNEAELAETIKKLREILADANTETFVKGEAYDALLYLTEREDRENSARGLESVLTVGGRDEILKRVDDRLRQEIPQLEGFDPDSLETLRSGEIFYLEREAGRLGIDFSRSIGFSYSFAVENEVKVRLRKKLQRLLSAPETYALIDKMLDAKINNLDLFFHQYILRLHQRYPFEFTTENVKQTLERIKQFEQCYKPDGLKALGILLLCFGREYSFNSKSGRVEVNNPLNLKGFKDDEEVIDFARQLVLLQHFRNPYIHPEISEMEKLSQLRQTAFTCLRYICRIN